MGDSDDERGGSDPGIDLTGFLFGNIDESGQLENDVLDNESKRHLASLGRLGLSSLLEEMIGGDVKEKKIKSESDSDEDGDLRDHDHAREAHHRHENGESNKDETLHGLPSILASWNLDE